MHRAARITASVLLLIALGHTSGINRAVKLMDGVSLIKTASVMQIAS